MTASGSRFHPLVSQPDDQGDPYLFAPPGDAHASFRYYCYVTGGDPVNGRAFPVYASDDLRSWTRLSNALVVPNDNWRWAPAVHYVAGVERPYVMLYSVARGSGGSEGHVNHRLRRADSRAPEGPFTETAAALLADRDFVIDPDIWVDRAGTRWLGFATDFEQDAPTGTGIARIRVNDALTETDGAIEVIGRASEEWQIYEPARRMEWKNIAGVDWERGDTVCWYCVEAPAGGVVSPGGREVVLYSGGNYAAFYAVGAYVERDDGGWIDTTVAGHFVLAPEPDAGFFGPGHCSVLQDSGFTYLAFHARYGSVEAPRQFSVGTLEWTGDDLPVCRPLAQ